MVEVSSDQVAEHQALTGRGWVKRRQGGSGVKVVAFMRAGNPG